MFFPGRRALSSGSAASLETRVPEWGWRVRMPTSDFIFFFSNIFGGCMTCFSYDVYVVACLACFMFPWGILSLQSDWSLSSLTTDLIMRVDVRPTTTVKESWSVDKNIGFVQSFRKGCLFFRRRHHGKKKLTLLSLIFDSRPPLCAMIIFSSMCHIYIFLVRLVKYMCCVMYIIYAYHSCVFCLASSYQRKKINALFSLVFDPRPYHIYVLCILRISSPSDKKK